jgi:hypothetical protein
MENVNSFKLSTVELFNKGINTSNSQRSFPMSQISSTSSCKLSIYDEYETLFIIRLQRVRDLLINTS